MEENTPSPSFYGQQSDEIVLYEIHPYWTRKFLGLLRAVVATLLGFGASYLYSSFLSDDSAYSFTFGVILSLIIGALIYGWFRFSANRAKAFITDRRFVRMEVSFPIFIKKRSLFWNEVLKVKGYAPNLLYRAMGVGTIAVQPIMSESGKEDVTFVHVHYFNDLTNYIEKLVYTHKSKPEELKNIRPFIPKPKGERF